MAVTGDIPGAVGKRPGFALEDSFERAGRRPLVQLEGAEGESFDIRHHSQLQPAVPVEIRRTVGQEAIGQLSDFGKADATEASEATTN